MSSPIPFLWHFAGGTFALFSLICRHVKTDTIPNQHPTDQSLTTYSMTRLEEGWVARQVKKWLEGSYWGQKILVILVLLGTSMLIGDGILTPAISGSGSVSID
jgi:KUP system potassium uptake protein